MRSFSIATLIVIGAVSSAWQQVLAALNASIAQAFRLQLSADNQNTNGGGLRPTRQLATCLVLLVLLSATWYAGHVFHGSACEPLM